MMMAAFCYSSYAQINDSSYKQMMAKEYLRKSKNQRKTGFILLGAGALATFTGAILINNSTDDPLNPGNWVDGGAGVGLATLGTISVIVSIPFLISSATNNSKAKKMSVGLKAEKIMHDKVPISSPSYYPALTARLSF